MDDDLFDHYREREEDTERIAEEAIVYRSWSKEYETDGSAIKEIEITDSNYKYAFNEVFFKF
jgi:hypothetical protein